MLEAIRRLSDDELTEVVNEPGSSSNYVRSLGRGVPTPRRYFD